MDGRTNNIYIHTRNYLETGNKANNMLMLAKGLLWRKHRTTSEGRADYFGGNSGLLLGKPWIMFWGKQDSGKRVISRGKVPDQYEQWKTP